MTELEQPGAGQWQCEAYGDAAAEIGALCFLAGADLGTRVCNSPAECHQVMESERGRVYDRITQLAAAGDPVGVFLAGEFTAPDQLLGGAGDRPAEEDHCHDYTSPINPAPFVISRVIGDDEPIGPNCPGCGRETMLQVSPTQLMCGNPYCSTLMWDPTQTPADMRTNGVHQVQLVRHDPADVGPDQRE
jgi:hypothetical protein